MQRPGDALSAAVVGHKELSFFPWLACGSSGDSSKLHHKKWNLKHFVSPRLGSQSLYRRWEIFTYRIVCEQRKRAYKNVNVNTYKYIRNKLFEEHIHNWLSGWRDGWGDWSTAQSGREGISLFSWPYPSGRLLAILSAHQGSECVLSSLWRGGVFLKSEWFLTSKRSFCSLRIVGRLWQYPSVVDYGIEE